MTVSNPAFPLLQAAGTIDLKSSPDDVWRLVRDFDAYDRWHPDVAGVVLLEGANNAPLAVREVDLGQGRWLMSELLEWSDEERRFRYRILKAPVPFVNYVGNVAVLANEGGGSKVRWTAQFRRRPTVDVQAFDDAGVTQVVEQIIRRGLDNLPVILGE